MNVRDREPEKREIERNRNAEKERLDKEKLRNKERHSTKVRDGETEKIRQRRTGIERKSNIEKQRK